MVIIDDIPRYTEEDKENLVIRRFSDEEYAEITKEWTHKVRSIRVRFLAFVSLLIIGSIVYDSIVKYILYIVLFAILFYWMVREVELKHEKSGALAEYYYEILVEKKLPSVSGKKYIPGTDCSLPTFNPVEGRDTTSGYRTIIYISSKDYMKSREGKTFRDTLPQDKFL